MPAMAVENAYSRFVFWLKVLLPLAALAILSTLFLVAESLDPDKAIPFAEVDVEKLLREQGVTRPSFGGMTAHGAEVTLSADTVRPVEGASGQFIGEVLSTAVTLPSGTEIDVAAPQGTIDAIAREATLSGGVHLASSLGYTVDTDRLVAHFEELQMETDGAVRATGPGVVIEAGKFLLERRTADGSYLLVFKDGVRLVYDPEP